MVLKILVESSENPNPAVTVAEDRLGVTRQIRFGEHPFILLFRNEGKKTRNIPDFRGKIRDRHPPDPIGRISADLLRQNQRAALPHPEQTGNRLVYYFRSLLHRTRQGNDSLAGSLIIMTQV